MAKKRYDKQALFNDYLLALWQGMAHIESTFQVSGLCGQVFGGHMPERNTSDFEGDSVFGPEARDHVEASDAWRTLSGLYDYAVDGLLEHGSHAEDLVLFGQEILQVLSTEHSSPSDAWFDIVAMGDARFGLHDGSSISPERLALLANVDLRTVRNAISAGELDAMKVMGEQHIEHDSAVRWLHGRRGFKPTRIINMRGVALEEVTSPLALASLLRERREKLKLDEHRDILPPAHPAASAQILNDLEDGVFTLTLDAAFPLANFYQLDRTEFLKTLMRCFYPEQYKALTGAA
ncbi:hypothetical protein [Thioalkalivibrio sulfidiphilus]|uniref:hypothetical protein n=1 Tax=Thioalkalivibrio sulfidiphilus TaxID=1033854 RepID=UPI003B2FA0A0